MKFAALAAAMIAVVLGTSGASALTLQLSKQNPSNVFGDHGYIAKIPILYGGGVTDSAYTGGFALKDSQGSFTAWCLDFARALQLPSNYTITTTTSAIDPGRLADIEKLFEVNYSTLNLADPNQSAGFQLALWEILYETGSSYSLSNGSFKAFNSAGAIADANAYLNNLTHSIVQAYQFTFYQSASSQNLISVMPVPLPAAGLLLGTGIVGLFAFKRRRAARKVPA